MEEILVKADERPWEPGASPGMQRKILRSGADGAPRVALLKLEPGFEMDAHTHALAENHYVLEGRYEAQGREYVQGSYHMIPRHTTHGPFRSPAGALVLVFWES